MRIWLARIICALPAIALGFIGTAAVATGTEDLRSTSYGSVSGQTQGGVTSYLGIPYARPPTGALRWRAPQPPRAWSNILEADTFGADCPGQRPLGNNANEDCLYLNVWTPAGNNEPNLPVLVWIYGGAFRSGSAAIELFDGAPLARKGAVLVTFAYRTGPLGFLAHPELTAEVPHAASGNYGLLDALEALRWVRENISEFGGDLRNVTIFGHSSGSESVNIFTASPLAAGLFHRAIGQSGSSFGVRRASLLGDAEKLGVAYMQRRGANDIAELRAMPVEDLLSRPEEKFEPNIDGWLLPAAVRTIYERGEQNDVPMLVGSTGMEMPSLPQVSVDDYLVNVRRAFGETSDDALQILGQARSAEGASFRTRELTNLEWGDYPAAIWTRLQAVNGRQPVYSYLFAYGPPDDGGSSGPARHGSELAYVFGTHRRTGAPAMSETDDRLHTLMSTYWINFARTGNPNAPGLPEWPASNESATRVMRFDAAGAAPADRRDGDLIDLYDVQLARSLSANPIR